MSNIANWANQNRWAALILIAFGDILLALLGVTIGIGLFQQGFNLTTPLIVVFAWVMLVAFYLFPKNKELSDAMGFITPNVLRTTCHFLLYFTAFLLFVAVGNRIPNKVYGHSMPQLPLPAYVVHQNNLPDTYKLQLNQKPGSVKMVSSVKYDLKEKVQIITLHQDIHNGPGSWLMLGICGLTAMIISLLLAGLSSNILCSGTEAAASLVSLVGLGVWIGGVVLFGMVVIGITR